MNSTKAKGIIFTDFDGTLFDSGRAIADKNYEALAAAKEKGYIRVIATGRSLFSFRQVAANLDRNIEEFIDYLIFSSGTGTLKCLPGQLEAGVPISEGAMIEKESLRAESAFTAAGLLFRHGIDFMIHSEVPENHYFTQVKSNGAVNPDYYRRINIYSDFASPLSPSDTESELDAIEKICAAGVSQLVAVIPPSLPEHDKYSAELLEYLKIKLSDCSIVRTTSPIDHNSLWIEIFNPEVSKSQAAARLADRFDLGAADCMAIGNDFNDDDLLSWAGVGVTVAEAPEVMRGNYPSAGPASEGAVARAVGDFINT